MTDLDIEAFSNGNKGLIICFIITILVANFYLIFVLVRKGGFFYTPKSLIMISMAIGDIFLALFPLIVLARVIFEERELSLSCSTARASTVYVKFLIHFVYGFGLITLAVELVRRYKTQQKYEKTTRNIIQSLIYSAAPWFIGLVVVLPITMAKLQAPDSESQSSEYGILTPILLRCFRGLTAKRGLSMYGVCVLLPAPLAVVVCLVMMCIRILPAYYTAPSIVTYQNPAQAVVVTSQNSMGNAVMTPQYPVSNVVGVQQNSITYPQGQQQNPNTYPQGQQQNPNTYPQGLHHNPIANPHGIQQYPIANPQGSEQYPTNGMAATSQIPTAPSNEKHNPNLGGSSFTPPPTQHPGQQYPPPAYPAQQYPLPQYPPPQYYNTMQYPPPYYPVQYTTQSNVVVAAPVYVVQPQNPLGPALIDPGREKNALLVVSFVHAVCVLPFAIFSMGVMNWFYLWDDVDTIIDATFFWLAIFRSLLTPLIFIKFNKGQ